MASTLLKIIMISQTKLLLLLLGEHAFLNSMPVVGGSPGAEIKELNAGISPIQVATYNSTELGRVVA